MKERPILFSAPMVRAILEGRKTQTRRVVKPIPQMVTDKKTATWNGDATTLMRLLKNTRRDCPYGQPGDRLWVRETWQYYDWSSEGEPCIRFYADNATTWPEPGTEAWADKLVDVWETLSCEDNYKIDNRARDRRWRPSIHMPRWASRILLEITGLRVERLQEISEMDAEQEGVPAHDTATAAYANLWNEINGANSWDANPWVWVIEFKRVQP